MTSHDALKTSITEIIDGSLGEDLAQLCLDLHAHPETAFQERYAVAAITAFLRDRGIDAETGTAGIETAFESRLHGGVGPTVAILAEYDALPELGHACGHNVIAAAGVGAFVALKELGRLPGVVRLVGTPAEEDGGGKVIMQEAGVFEGTDAAMMIHPFDRTYSHVEFAGRAPMTVTFHGRASHAGGAPEAGINALDAAIVFFNGINALRSRLIGDSRVHGVIVEGGTSAAVIPERARVDLYLRAYDQNYLESMVEWVSACARGAALQIGCTVEISSNGALFKSFKCDAGLARAFSSNLDRIGHVHERAEFRAFAATDFGNVSHGVASIHPYLGMGDGLVCHTREFEKASGDARGLNVMRDGAKALAMTAIDVLYGQER